MDRYTGCQEADRGLMLAKGWIRIGGQGWGMDRCKKVLLETRLIGKTLSE